MSQSKDSYFTADLLTSMWFRNHLHGLYFQISAGIFSTRELVPHGSFSKGSQTQSLLPSLWIFHVCGRHCYLGDSSWDLRFTLLPSQHTIRPPNCCILYSVSPLSSVPRSLLCLSLFLWVRVLSFLSGLCNSSASWTATRRPCCNHSSACLLC